MNTFHKSYGNTEGPLGFLRGEPGYGTSVAAWSIESRLPEAKPPLALFNHLLSGSNQPYRLRAIPSCFRHLAQPQLLIAHIDRYWH